MRLTARLVLAVFAIIALALMGTMSAQSTRGTIAGVVTDQQGAVVTGATVTATAVEGGEVRSATTGPQGEYRIEPLNPGTYSILVSATGFSKVKVDNIVVRTSSITSNNVQLSVGGTSETLEVQASADTIQTETGELSKTIPQTAIQDLPYASLNPYSLAVTLPGVATVAGRDDMTNGTSFSVNGLRPRSNNFLIDGFDNNDNGIAGQAFQPNNIESVQEVTVKTNSYSAEYGRGGGSVSNLSFRSGSNDVHGALWENYSGSKLNALDYPDKRNDLTRPAQFVNNIFGFRVGGPAIKNKLFYFGTIQWNRWYGAQAADGLYLPTEAGVNTLKSLQSVSPTANSQIQLLLDAVGGLRGSAADGYTQPVGDRAGCAPSEVDGTCSVDYGFFQRSDKGASLSREITGRVDYAGQNDSIFVRYTDSMSSLTPDLFANSSSLPYADTQQGGPARILGTMWAHTFTPNVINEFRFSAQQLNFSFSPTAATLANPMAHLPQMWFTDSLGFYFGGFSGGLFPQGRGHKTIQFQDAIAINKGAHNMKFGVDLATLLINDQVPFNSDGTIVYSGGGDCSDIGLGDGTGDTLGCTDLANYVDGYLGPAGRIAKVFGNPRTSVPTTQQAYYFQDSWKLRPNFTLDYGIRYEYQPPDASNVLLYPALDPTQLATADFRTRWEQQPDRNNWAPRVGVSYTPKFWKSIFGEDKTVIRGGFGMFYDTFFTNMSNNTAATSPNAIGFNVDANTVPGRGFQNPLPAALAAGPVPNPLATTTSTYNNLVNPQTYQWNLNVQREVLGKTTVEVAYVGTRGERLFNGMQINPMDPDLYDTVNKKGVRVMSNRGSIIMRANQGDSIYHGLQTQVSRTVKSLTVRGSYTWSRALDNTSEIFQNGTNAGSRYWMDLADPRSDRGPSNFNRTHRAAISYVYQLPALKGHGFLTAAFGGWETSGVLSFQSGTPGTIYLNGVDQNGDGETNNDRPFWGNPNAALDYSSACRKSGSGCITGIGRYTSTGDLVDAWSGATGTVSEFRYIYYPVNSGMNGNVTRNNFTFPGRMDWNATVIKHFRMPYAEGHEFQLRVDLFNPLNHRNLGVTSLNTNVRDQGFLNMDNTRSGNRTMSLWLKYQF